MKPINCPVIQHHVGPKEPNHKLYWSGYGWMTAKEFSEKLEQDIDAYARREPLKWRQAMSHLYPVKTC